jgi:hypothetical protein
MTGRLNSSAAILICSKTWLGLLSLISLAVLIRRDSSGAECTINQGSIAIQCPPTPGFNILTRG